MKKRPETFKFRLSNDERQAIADLAARLQRSQSDAVRFVVIEAARQLAQDQDGFVPSLPMPANESNHEGINVSK